MGVRTYEIAVERMIFVKARNKTEVQKMMDTGEVPIYEGETITRFCEKKPDREMMTKTPVYSPKVVLRRQMPIIVTSAVSTETQTSNIAVDNVIPFPTSHAQNE